MLLQEVWVVTLWYCDYRGGQTGNTCIRFISSLSWILHAKVLLDVPVVSHFAGGSC